MKYFIKELFFTLLSFFYLAVFPMQAQEKAEFSISSFKSTPFDLTAQNEECDSLDSDGKRYAIIKVTSENTNDNMEDYTFDFGSIYHFVEKHDEELWIYVQRNAKLVTITRKNYRTISKHDLGEILQAGHTYRMVLKSANAIVHYQLVQFDISPKHAEGVVFVKPEGGDEIYFGKADKETGSVAKSLPYGTYEYRIASDKYIMSSAARFTLNDQNVKHYEKVKLKPNFSTVTLKVKANAEIYINNEKKGWNTWTGTLNAGNHLVECKQAKHNNSIQNITVVAEHDSIYQINPPTPKVGVLTLTSTPLGATVTIDGKKHGLTPIVINDLLIGNHELTLGKEEYKVSTRPFDIIEKQTTNIDIALKRITKRKVRFYLDAGAAVGTSMNFGFNAGLFYKKMNAEFFYNLGLSDETFYINSESAPLEENVGFQEMGMRLGYGFKLGSRFQITPQLGLASLSIKGDNLKSSATSLLIGAKCEYLFSRHWGLTLSPEGRFGLNKGDIHELLAEKSSKAKAWATGVNVRLGVEFYF